jgi:hypothetical protein
MDAGPHVYVTRGCAAAAVHHRTPAGTRELAARAPITSRRATNACRNHVGMIYAKHKSLNHDFLASRNLGPAASRVPAALLAVLALALDPGVGAHALPPQSRQGRLMRSCSQMLVPRQSSQAPLAVIPADAGAPHGGYARRCWHPRSPFTGAWCEYAPCRCSSRGYAGRCWRLRSPCTCSSVMLADAGAPAVLAPAPLAVISHFMRPPLRCARPCPPTPPPSPFPTPACLPLLHRIVRLLPRRVAVSPLLAALAALALLLPVPAPAPLHQMGQARDRSSSAALPVRHRGRVHVVWIVRR